MSVYAERARRGFKRLVQQVIDDDPVEVYRDREEQPDKFRDKQTVTAGPFRMRLEGFRHTRVAFVFDEKGQASVHGFVLLGTDLPVGTFKLMDIARVNGRSYRVTSCVEREVADGMAGIVEVAMELLN